MNQVNLIGHIGGEPEVKSFQSGKRVARFSIAINNYTRDKDNPPAPTWIPCEFWDASVDRLLKCREKGKLTGRKIQITGALALNTYNSMIAGEQKTLRKLYVKVYTFQLLGTFREETADETTVDPETGEVLTTAASTSTRSKRRKSA